MNYAKDAEKVKIRYWGKFKKMFNKIVITGGAGFVGSHVYDHFSSIYSQSKLSFEIKWLMRQI